MYVNWDFEENLILYTKGPLIGQITDLQDTVVWSFFNIKIRSYCLSASNPYNL